MHKNYLIFILALLFSLVTIACDSKETRPPIAGEYGEKSVALYQLTSEEVQALNTSQEGFQKGESISMSFEGTPADNPFRIVAVVRGVAENDGEIDLRFIANVANEKGESAPNFMHEEDTTSYDKNSKVLLVLPSEPFSLDASTGDEARELNTNIILAKRNNITLESVELQVWQGQGKRSTTLRTALFAIFILSIIAGIIKLMSAKWRINSMD